MATSIYSIPIESTVKIARHYFISSDETFENSLGWGSKSIEYKGKGAILTSEQKLRAKEYSTKFGQYNIHTNNCGMFAWYVMTGRRYSHQTQNKTITKLGSGLISLFQPVLTVRSMDGYKLKKAIANKLTKDLEQAKKNRLNNKQSE